MNWSALWIPLAVVAASPGCAHDGAPPRAAAEPAAAEPAAVQRPRRVDLAATERIAAWLRTCSIETDHGLVWPSDPQDAGSISTNLYDGTPGVVLFFLQRHRVTHGADPRDLRDAVAGADHLLATLPNAPAPAGLYVGVAGVGFVLDEVHRVTDEERFGQGARRCVALLEESAIRTDLGVTWNGTTDVISGSAGAGLWLLDRWRREDDRRALALAVDVGRELLAVAEPTEHGARWPMRPGYARWMPNFSHGTAGVAYFLLELDQAFTPGHRPSVDHVFLDAAVAGADHLRAIRSEDGLICHHTPGGEDLFYLGWCHGPTGTARLFWRLAEVTGDPSYRADVQRMARALRDAGIPERRTPGFWNNVGICCGSAGVAAFLDDLGRAKGDGRDTALVRRLTDDLVERGTDDGAGLRWRQAEHRARPDLLIAQTGLMQGAAGIGLWLLQAAHPGDDVERLRWPDSPW